MSRRDDIKDSIRMVLDDIPAMSRAALVRDITGHYSGLAQPFEILAIVSEMQEAGELLLWHAMRAGRVSALVGLPDATLTQAMPPQACCGPVAGPGEASEPAAVPQAGVPLLTQEVVKAALLLRQWADNHNLTGRWHIAGIGGVEVR